MLEKDAPFFKIVLIDAILKLIVKSHCSFKSVTPSGIWVLSISKILTLFWSTKWRVVELLNDLFCEITSCTKRETSALDGA